MTYKEIVQQIITNVEMKLTVDNSLDFEFKTFANPSYSHIGIKGVEPILANNGITITEEVVIKDKYEQTNVNLTIMLNYKTNYTRKEINSHFDKIKNKFKKEFKKEELI